MAQERLNLGLWRRSMRWLFIHPLSRNHVKAGRNLTTNNKPKNQMNIDQLVAKRDALLKQAEAFTLVIETLGEWPDSMKPPAARNGIPEPEPARGRKAKRKGRKAGGKRSDKSLPDVTKAILENAPNRTMEFDALAKAVQKPMGWKRVAKSNMLTKALKEIGASRKGKAVSL
jgi:hypothetical protein